MRIFLSGMHLIFYATPGLELAILYWATVGTNEIKLWKKFQLWSGGDYGTWINYIYVKGLGASWYGSDHMIVGSLM